MPAAVAPVALAALAALAAVLAAVAAVTLVAAAVTLALAGGFLRKRRPGGASPAGQGQPRFRPGTGTGRGDTGGDRGHRDGTLVALGDTGMGPRWHRGTQGWRRDRTQ